ncbi:MAG TPA: ComEA family DNA-binding protein [Acholeplasma sp.]|jgi:competence protein ComEA|nr:ComEA family DNA-binding protein [Acholeplasma sp.]
MKKKKIIIIVSVVVGLIVAGIIISLVSKPKTEDPIDERREVMIENIVVEIKGEVYHPGLYILEQGSRINDLIELSGGFTKDANGADLNLAKVLSDGEVIIVSKKGESSTITENKIININYATVEQLMELSGIGETKAKAIVTYREQHGRFKKIEDIMNVTGISNALFERIKEQITV